ncbi:MAG TPA: electron transfer flavoprotein subunit beta/FixA family protein [Bacteroidota bacterium]|nr:electron transfer flavoprotein subunit beta/FixA family protein [Bacteroidota bacterium]
MNIYVCVSHVPDTTTKVQVGGDGKHIDPNGVTFILNPYDEYAVEAALQLKEARGGEVVAVCVGPEAVKETIRKALAMGADKGMHIVSDDQRDSFGVARAIADALADKNPDVLFLGRQSIDYDGWQMAGLLGEMLAMPSVSVVAKLDIAEDGSFTAVRDIEGGQETVTSKLPAVISTQKGLNEPRYPKLQGIMAAKRKPIDEVTPAAYSNRVETVTLAKPPIKSAGRIVGEGPAAAAELVRLLHEEAKVI